MKRYLILIGGLVVLAAAPANAQVGDRITIVLNGTSKAQPGLIVLAGRGLDSVRTIVQRDLLNSDRFTVSVMTDSAATLNAAFDPASTKEIAGLSWVVELEPAPGGISVKLWDAATGVVRQQGTRTLDPAGLGDGRLAIHRVSDDVVNWTGGVGIAATRIAFKMKNGTAEDAIWRIDSDGANLVRVSRGGGSSYAMTPAWSPDGAMISYSEYRDGRWTLYVKKLASGTRTAITTKEPGDADGGNFHPDGRTMVFTFMPPSGSGAIIETVDAGRNCCAHELTHDRRNADNSSASYSPDGRHIVYISNRTGTPQIWVMDADGLGADQMVPTEANERGHPLDTYSPAWSPDNTRILFTRDTPGGGRQLWKWSIGSSVAQQLTSLGRNEDATWAPDSRHVVFKSTRSGREQLWIYDVESTSIRQLNTPGGAQFPSWSPILGTNP